MTKGLNGSVAGPHATAAGATTARAGEDLVLLRATQAEAAGAGLRVAGLRVVDRALAQLQRQGRRVVIAHDGSCALPAELPAVIVLRRIDPERTAAELAALRAALGAPAEVAADEVRPQSRSLEGGLRVHDEASRRRAEDAIFAELLRGDLGFVARHLNKPLSFRFTRHVLCHLPVTPNQVTIGAGLIGLLGALLVASGRAGLMVTGFLLAHLQSVLDGCDGELARVRFQQSAIGEWLDTIVDDALNLVLFAAVGIGAYRAGLGPWALGLGLAAAAMLLGYNAIAYRELLRQGVGGEVIKIRWWFTAGADLKSLYGGGGKKGLFQHLLTIGRRDFFLLAWLLFALAGRVDLVVVYAFLVAASNFGVAVGQLLFGARAS
jgi:phosphatidylglycerophosphate synthase